MAVKEKLLAMHTAHQVLIVMGETGSGKTTQIPQFILDHHMTTRGPSGEGPTPGYTIAVTQPRRVAAVSLAKRVAQERNSQVGQTVGYSVRFDECSSARETRIKYLTDGMLLREFLSDPLLSRYNCVVVDEAHERTLRTDIIFGLLKRLLSGPRRDTLTAIIMSASMNPQKFIDYFEDARVLTVPGRQHPVRLFYALEPQADYLEAALTCIVQLHREKPANEDVLVFLTGQEEIEHAQRQLEDYEHLLESKVKLLVCPIYAAMASNQQMEALKRTPHGCRKVILATNIAETSITIPGVR